MVRVTVSVLSKTETDAAIAAANMAQGLVNVRNLDEDSVTVDLVRMDAWVQHA